MSKLPLEPKEEKDEGQPVSKLRFRVPVRAHDDLETETGNEKKNASQANGIVKGGTGNQQLERRFLASNTLQTVLDYLTTEGYPSSDFKVLCSWPRRDVSSLKLSLVYFDGKQKVKLVLQSMSVVSCSFKPNFFLFQLTTLDARQTLKTLKLYPQETLILEEK